MPVTYVAYTERSLLMLDERGICVRVEPLRGNASEGASDGALRCIGAQYVASIDPSEPGGLTRLPCPGTSMLFAAIDPGGRIFCVRAGPLTHFESSEADDSGVHSAPLDTQKQPLLEFHEVTDPDLSISVDLEDSDDMQTVPFLVERPPSDPPPPPRSGRAVRESAPPPVPRLPRLRPFVPSTPVRQEAQSVRSVVPRTPVQPTPYGGAGTGRGRPPAPSSHAWEDEPRPLGRAAAPGRTRWGR